MNLVFYTQIFWSIAAFTFGLLFFFFLPKQQESGSSLVFIWWATYLVVILSLSFRTLFPEQRVLFDLVLGFFSCLNFYFILMLTGRNRRKYLLLFWVPIFLFSVSAGCCLFAELLPFPKVIALFLIFESVIQIFLLLDVPEKVSENFFVFMKGIFLWNVLLGVIGILFLWTDSDLSSLLIGFSYMYFLSILFLEFDGKEKQLFHKRMFNIFIFVGLFMLLFVFGGLSYSVFIESLKAVYWKAFVVSLIFFLFYFVLSKLEKKAKGSLLMKTTEKLEMLVLEMSRIGDIIRGNLFENLNRIFQKILGIDNAHVYWINEKTGNLELAYSYLSPRFVFDNIEQIKKDSFLSKLIFGKKIPNIFVKKEIATLPSLSDEEREELWTIFQLLNAEIFIRLQLKERFLGFIALGKTELEGEEQNPAYWHKLYRILPMLAQITDMAQGKRNIEREKQSFKLVEAEMNVTHRLQTHLYPSRLKKNGLMVSSANFSDNVIGCDLYDYFWLDENKLAFYLIDINDHSVHSALIMMFIRAAIKNFYRIKKEVFPAFDSTMNFIMDEYESVHIEVCMGLVDLKYERLDLVTSGEFVILFGQPGMWKTIQNDNRALKKSMLFEKGLSLFVMSDGVNRHTTWPIEEILDTMIEPAHRTFTNYEGSKLYFSDRIENDVSIIGLSREKAYRSKL